VADIALRTILPIFLLIGTGFLARKGGILRAGDERVLSAYLYFFALPALFLVNMAETEFTSRTLRFILAGLIPGFLSVGLYLGLFFLLRLRIDTLYLLILSTVFGSHAFFGIPFVIFAFPTPEGERLAILAASFISMGSVFVSLTVLELYGLGRASLWEGSRRVAGRLVRNPLLHIRRGLPVAVRTADPRGPLDLPPHARPHHGHGGPLHARGLPLRQAL